MRTAYGTRGDAPRQAGFNASLIEHPALRRLHDYWNDGRKGAHLPGRHIVQPASMRPWLGNLSLIDVHRDPARFHFRLCGSAFVERLGLDLTGQDLAAIPDPAYRAYAAKQFLRLVATGEPSLSRYRRFIDAEPYDFEVLRLPFADDGRTVSMLLICPMYFVDPPQDFALGSGRLPEFQAPIPLD